ncbi:MAG: CsbD family protein, partial [Chloroflexi bacterium]
MGEFGDKVEGEVKDTGGKLTGDKKMEWEGKAQKAKGN